ncbi:MAG: DUF167 domain-containing protein [Alphaproteobacteria bacterium]|nr:DUF167 domain-containing protein [Alphaproteobacteria bacterium]
MTAKPYSATTNGIRLAVRLTPRASRDGLDGIGLDADGRPVLRIRLAAPPVEGAANQALIDFLAGMLAVRKKDIVIRSGETGRLKILEVDGKPDALAARIDALV